jgi:hypothetical protein
VARSKHASRTYAKSDEQMTDLVSARRAVKAGGCV